MKTKILELHHSGSSYDEISDIIGCSKSTVAYHCSSKVRAHSKISRNKNRKKQRIELKMEYGGKCSVCGYNISLSALHFHHLNQSEKVGEVGDLFSLSKKKAFEEAKKCILICSNCHCEFHDGIIDLQSVLQKKHASLKT